MITVFCHPSSARCFRVAMDFLGCYSAICVVSVFSGNNYQFMDWRLAIQEGKFWPECEDNTITERQ